MNGIIGRDLRYIKLKWRKIPHWVETDDLTNYKRNIWLLNWHFISENWWSLRHAKVSYKFAG